MGWKTKYILIIFFFIVLNTISVSFTSRLKDNVQLLLITFSLITLISQFIVKKTAKNSLLFYIILYSSRYNTFHKLFCN